MQQLSNNDDQKISVERAVRERYGSGARAREAALCCPVDYDARYLKIIPEEIIARDYGCGDPSCYVRQGETVLDLGSGGGKICYIASQIVGPSGRVIGVDMNEEMLALARRHQQTMAKRIGHQNVDFRRGKIQDLRLDLDRADVYLKENPIQNITDMQKYDEYMQQQRLNNPMIPDSSVDLVVSNCVLNLVSDQDKRQLFAEIYRVLKKGGRIAISDIVSDETVPEAMRNDPELWSGCISGAFREADFLHAFAEVGFHGIRIDKWDQQPWQTVNGIEFRSITVTAYKGKEGPCMERNQAVIYRGPWKAVIDDDGHTLQRGERMAVCDKTFNLYRQEPYGDNIIAIEPRQTIAPADAQPFNCSKNARREPRASKGMDYDVTEIAEGSVCGGASCC